MMHSRMSTDKHLLHKFKFISNLPICKLLLVQEQESTDIFNNMLPLLKKQVVTHFFNLYRLSKWNITHTTALHGRSCVN